MSGKPLTLRVRQSLMGETTAGASSRRSRTPDASSRETRPRHWLPNALPPLGASLSLWEKTALAHYEDVCFMFNYAHLLISKRPTGKYFVVVHKEQRHG